MHLGSPFSRHDVVPRLYQNILYEYAIPTVSIIIWYLLGTSTLFFTVFVMIWYLLAKISVPFLCLRGTLYCTVQLVAISSTEIQYCISYLLFWLCCVALRYFRKNYIFTEAFAKIVSKIFYQHDNYRELRQFHLFVFLLGNLVLINLQWAILSRLHQHPQQQQKYR